MASARRASRDCSPSNAAFMLGIKGYSTMASARRASRGCSFKNAAFMLRIRGCCTMAMGGCRLGLQRYVVLSRLRHFDWHLWFVVGKISRSRTNGVFRISQVALLALPEYQIRREMSAQGRGLGPRFYTDFVQYWQMLGEMTGCLPLYQQARV